MAVVAEDAYFRDQSDLSMEARLKVNYDHPDALEHELLLVHLHRLRSGRAIKSPSYDYARHTRASAVRMIDPATLVLVEGVHILHDHRLRELFDLSVFLDTPLDLCLRRRIERDIRERGRTEESVRQQFEEAVLPMYRRFVVPVREHADLVAGQSELGGEQVNELGVHIESLLGQPGTPSRYN